MSYYQSSLSSDTDHHSADDFVNVFSDKVDRVHASTFITSPQYIQLTAALDTVKTLTQAGNVTVGLASHWPCVTDTVVYPPTGSTAKDREMSTHTMSLLGVALFTIYLYLRHHRLLRLQHSFGFQGSCLSWFVSYLSERTYCIVADGVTSQIIHVVRSVPQGSYTAYSYSIRSTWRK